MGCQEPLAGGVGQSTRWAGSGLVRTEHAGGHFEIGPQALLWMGWRAATLSRGCYKRRETLVGPGQMRCDELCTAVGVGTLVERVERGLR